MTRKRRRLLVLLAGLGALGIATALVLSAFEDTLVFFYSPSDFAERPVIGERAVRLGGLVESGSVRRGDGLLAEFAVTDGAHAVRVRTDRPLPDLFREGQGVVVEGRLGDDGIFAASTVLARHDEAYMPPEVADALKRAGTWHGEGPLPATGPGAGPGAGSGELAP